MSEKNLELAALSLGFREGIEAAAKVVQESIVRRGGPVSEADSYWQKDAQHAEKINAVHGALQDTLSDIRALNPTPQAGEE